MESLFLKSLWNIPIQNMLKNLLLNICEQCISSNEEELLENMFLNGHEWCLDYFFKNSKYHSIFKELQPCTKFKDVKFFDYHFSDEEISDSDSETSDSDSETSDYEYTSESETSDSEINEDIKCSNYINILEQFNKNNEKLLAKFNFMNSITKQILLFKKYCQPNLFYKNLYSDKIEKLLDEKISYEQIRDMKQKELEELLSMIQIN